MKIVSRRQFGKKVTACAAVAFATASLPKIASALAPISKLSYPKWISMGMCNGGLPG